MPTHEENPSNAAPGASAQAEPVTTATKPADAQPPAEQPAPQPKAAPQPQPSRPLRQPAPVQPPSMGRIVHYRARHRGEMPHGHEFHAAMITGVNPDGTVALTVFPRGYASFFVDAAKPSIAGFDVENSEPGTWCWPSRV